MDSPFGRPQSPVLDEPLPQHHYQLPQSAVGHFPQSPNLSAHQFSSDNLDHCTGAASPSFDHLAQQPRQYSAAPLQHDAFSTYQPTSVPQQAPLYDQQYYNPATMPPRRTKSEYYDGDENYDPGMNAPSRTRRTRGMKQEQEQDDDMNGQSAAIDQHVQIKDEGGTAPDSSDPTQGCHIKTSFPVARIKRIMQADEDIGKVAQVTPTVVSRALELFMIKLISAAAHQAIGPAGHQAGASKGPKRVLVQHLKKAVMADTKLDFLEEKVSTVPDAPLKAKKEAGSDSEDAKPKKKGKKRKDSGDDL